jgi:hypothetical protein
MLKAVKVTPGITLNRGVALYKCEGGGVLPEYVIVSAVRNGWVHETYIFPASREGRITDWLELEGSEKNTTSHEKVLSNAGYEIVSE